MDRFIGSGGSRKESWIGQLREYRKMIMAVRTVPISHIKEDKQRL